jgi:hypothetical protein
MYRVGATVSGSRTGLHKASSRVWDDHRRAVTLRWLRATEATARWPRGEREVRGRRLRTPQTAYRGTAASRLPSK